MSYIICFWDKSKLQVNDQTGEKLQNAIMAEEIKNFKLGSNFYAVGGVEKIITKESAWNVFPTEFELLKNMDDQKAILPALDNNQKKLT